MFKKKSPLKAEKLVKRKRRILYLKIFVVVLLVGGLCYSVVLVSRLQYLQITEVIVEGAVAIDPQEIKTIAEQNIAGNYLYVFPRANRLLYPKQIILQTITERYKRLESVVLKRSGHTLRITISERVPAFMWCKGSGAETKQDCYFVDKTGYIYAPAPIFSGNTFFIFHGLVTAPDPIGSFYIDATQFLFLQSFVTYLKDKSVDVFALDAQEDGTYTFYLDKGGKLIVDSRQRLESLKPVIETLIINEELLSSTSKSVEYIDLRYGNKVFFKQNGDNPVEEVH